MDQLLDDPFYQQFVIYVHPRGIRPIGYHVARLLDRNPRTPFSIDLAVHNLHTTLYRRWREAQLRLRGYRQARQPDPRPQLKVKQWILQ